MAVFHAIWIAKNISPVIYKKSAHQDQQHQEWIQSSNIIKGQTPLPLVVNVAYKIRNENRLDSTKELTVVETRNMRMKKAQKEIHKKLYEWLSEAKKEDKKLHPNMPHFYALIQWTKRNNNYYLKIPSFFQVKEDWCAKSSNLVIINSYLRFGTYKRMRGSKLWLWWV